MTKIVVQNSLGHGARQIIIRTENGLKEAYLERGQKLEDANWQNVQPQDPAAFGEAMYHQGQGWLFVGYCVLMTPFFLIAVLLFTGQMQWTTVELLGRVCGIPAFLFILFGMPIVIARKAKRS